MNKIFSCIFGIVIGAGIGSIGGYIYFKKKYEDMYYESLRNAIDEECERIRKDHEELLKKIRHEQESFYLEKKEAKTEEVLEINTDPHEAEHTKAGVNGYQATLLAAEAYISVTENAERPLQSDEPPREIDEDEFRFLPSDYEIYEFQYFKGNNVVLDENDEVVDTPNLYISGLEQEIAKKADSETMYILIERLKVAIEMVIYDDQYEEECFDD